MDNRSIAQMLSRHARCLKEQDAGLYRVRAYRRAVETVLGWDEPIERIVAERGRRGLQELPAIGSHIARTIETLVQTGQLPNVNETTHPAPLLRARGVIGSGAQNGSRMD